MKNICLIVVFTLCISSGFSQVCTSPPNCIQNGGYANNSGPGNVNTGNLPNWYVSHGTPSLFNGFGSQDTFSVWMWSYSGNGEGIYTCFNFQAGHTYRICIDLRCSNNPATGVIDSITVINNAMGGTGAYFSIQASNSNYSFPANPGSEIINNSFFTNTSWQTYTYLYTPSVNYSSLWLFPYMSIPSGPAINWGQYEVQIDNVKIEEVANPTLGLTYPGGGTAFATIYNSPTVGGQWVWSPPGVVTVLNADGTQAEIDSCGSFNISAQFVPQCEICSVYQLDTTVNISCCSLTGVQLNDTSICSGSPVQIGPPSGPPAGYSYMWTPPTNLNDPYVYNPVFSATNNTGSPVVYTYNLIGDSAGMACFTEPVSITVYPEVQVDLGPDDVFCNGTQYTLNAANPGSAYLWGTGQATATITTDSAGIYSVTVTSPGGCTASDSVYLTTSGPPYQELDTVICEGSSVMLSVTGGVSYQWTPAAWVSNPSASAVIATPVSPVDFVVQVTDANGCSVHDTLSVDFHPSQGVDLGPDAWIYFGDSYQLFAGTSGNYSWSPAMYLSCTACPDPVATPMESMGYKVVMIDSNGCRYTDSIYIHVEGSLYVPNTFTPNSDGMNDIFRAYGRGIQSFSLHIFDRWGEQIFRSDNLLNGWDGTYREKICQLGVYVWKISYVEVSGKEGEIIGHVNLLR